MALKSQKQVLLAKVEATYGVDPLPTGAANAMLVSGLKINPIVTGSADRKVIAPYFGNMGKIITERHAEISFDVELSTSGVFGIPPAYGLLFKGCAMSETITAGVSVVYSPISSLEQSLTLYANVDGMLYKMIGARGNVTAKLSAKGVPMLTFKYIALYASPSDVVMPAAVLSEFRAPLAVTAQNTTAMFHGYAALVSDFSFDLGNKMAYRSLINNESVIFGDRSSTGSVTMEQPTMLGKDFFAAVTSGTAAGMTVTHGTVAGSKVVISMPQAQPTDVQLSDLDGVQMIQMPLQMQPLVGNDEITLTYN